MDYNTDSQYNTNQNIDRDKSQPTYVVTRDGIRVSDIEYDSPSTPACLSELEFWKRVVKNHSHDEKVEVVLYDAKKHRIW